jgi:phage-related tail fiber protein
MTYQKMVWQDEILDGQGNVVQEGTWFTADRANKIEQGIADAHMLAEAVAQTAIGNAVSSGLTFTSTGLTANYTAGTAYVNGVRFDVTAGSIALTPTQGQYIYLDSDGTVKNTTSQATAQAKCLLWYFATDASSVITSTDSRKAPGVPDASTTQKGIVKLNDSTNSTSTTEAATPNAVKQVKDSIPALDNTVTSISTTKAATANSVKTAYDKAVSVESVVTDLQVKMRMGVYR